MSQTCLQVLQSKKALKTAANEHGVRQWFAWTCRHLWVFKGLLAYQAALL